MIVDEWRRLRSRTIAECRVFDVREDECRSTETGEEATFFVIENPDWVNVIPVTTNDEIVLIQQYRQGTESVTLEIPGGLIDEGEEPAVAASRELTEETGYSSSKIVYLGKSSPNPALQSNTIYHFAALDCVQDGETKFDEHESIASTVVEQSEISELIASNEISHSLVVAGFYYFEKYLEKNES